MQDKIETGRRNLSELVLVIILFLLFALSALGLVILGGDVYANVLERMDENFALRTPLAYVSTKVRQGDGAGALRLDEESLGTPALVLTEEGDGESYETWIYFYEGALREYYVIAGTEFLPDDGLEVVKAENFTIEETEDGMLRLGNQVRQGQETELLLAPRAGRS